MTVMMTDGHHFHQVASLRKGSGHVFVGQVSWKDESSIPVITSAEVTASQFANSCPSPSTPLPTVLHHSLAVCRCITITLHDALSSAEDPPVLAVVELPTCVPRPSANVENSFFRTVKVHPNLSRASR